MAKGETYIEFSDQEIADKKKAVFESMGKRAQERVLKKGYEKWNPFEEPKDPIDIRTDVSKRTSQQLLREFLQNCEKDCSSTYSGGAWEMCLGIINSNEKIRGMYEFAVWYHNLLIKEGHEDKSSR